MIYPRLKLARDLLTDDGAIFISINDCEQENLKKICSEIFGENNFISDLIWANKEGGGSSDSKWYKTKHEHIFVYAKNKENCEIFGEEQEEDSSYSFEDKWVKERGKYKLIKLNSFSISYSKSLDYPICTDSGEIIEASENGKRGCWRWSKEKYEWGLKNDFIVIKKGADGLTKIYTKQYFKVDNNNNEIIRKLPPLSLIEKFSSTMASKELETLMGSHIFDYSKPLKLLLQLLKNKTSKNDIVLDFFSGSATTAHAVMQLNAEDGGNRKFIMVQLPELTDEKSEAYKAGYKNICEIGKERIRRAGQKIKQETQKDIDYGFRCLKLDESCMKDVYYSPSEYKQNLLDSFESNIKEDRTAEDLLFQVMLDMGVLLSSEIKVIDIEGKKVFNVNDGNLVCCFEDNITEDVVIKIAKLQPLYAVFRDSSFVSDSIAVNFDQIFETYSPTTTRKII